MTLPKTEDCKCKAFSRDVQISCSYLFNSTELLQQNPAATVDIASEALRIRRKIQTEFILDHPGYDVSLFVFRQSNPIRRFCQACVPSLYEERIFGRKPDKRKYALQLVLFGSVIASIVIAAIATPEYRRKYYEDHGLSRSSWFDMSEIAIGVVFLVEAVIKIIADGFFFTPNGYLRSLWNILDFLVLLSVIVVAATSLIWVGGYGRFTRALTALRALRLITLTHHMRDAFYTVIFSSALGLLQASALMILYLVPFAIWGINLFSGRLYSCNDEDSAGMASCIGEYIATPVDDSLGFLAPRVWVNPDPMGSEWDFDRFRSSLLILFEIVSLEGWTSVLASIMNITNIGEQSKKNASQWNAIFLVLFILFGSILILALFLS